MKKIAFICFFLFPILLQSQEDEYLKYLDDTQKLFYFIETSQLDSLKALVESRKVSPDYVSKDNGLTPIILAAEIGNLPIVEYLLSKEVNVNSFVYVTRHSPLIYAVSNENFQTAEKIIRAGADVNYQDVKGLAAIHYAVDSDLYAYVDMLLYYDADPNLKDKLGYSPICYALENDNRDILNLLLLDGADKNVLLADGSSLLHIAAARGNLDFVKDNINIIEYGLNDKQESPLDWAIINGQSEMVEWFLDYGFTIRKNVNELYTPYSLAKYSGDKKTKKLVKSFSNNEINYSYFRRMFFGYDLLLNYNFLFMCFNAGITEDRYGFQLETGFASNAFHNKVLFPYDDKVFLQLKESRRSVYFALEKKFKLFSMFENSYLGLDARVRTYYFWGNYRGVNIKLTKNIVSAPSIGISYNSNDVASFYFMCEYLRLPVLINYKPFLYNFGLKFFIKFRNEKIEKKYKYIINY